MTTEEIIIPRWLLERIEDTLRIQYNINLDKKSGETCQDRNIKESLNGVRKLLNGEELTGCERLEKLQPPLPEGIEEAARKYSMWCLEQHGEYVHEDPYECFIAGAEWQAGKDEKDLADMLTVEYLRGAEWGKQDTKKQMMENAVEGKVFMSFAPGHNQVVVADVDLPTNTKVKLIIVKEDE